MPITQPVTAEKLLIDLRDAAAEDFDQRRNRVIAWKTAHYTLGVIPSIAIIFTGAAVLTNIGVPVPLAGLVVLISGALSLAVTFYDFRGRMVNNFTARAAWGRLRDLASAALADKSLDEAAKLEEFRSLSEKAEQIRLDEAKSRVEKT